jgi:hypothetical protein
MLSLLCSQLWSSIWAGRRAASRRSPAGAVDRVGDVHGRSLADPLGATANSGEGLLQRMLPSPDDTAPDHPGAGALVNAGSARESFAPIGSNLPDYDNYFCRDCRRIVHVRKGSAGFRACPTPGCTRPTGFGAFAKVPRPSQRRSAPP